MDSDVKQQIIEKSVELFEQYGIRSVSIDDVCQSLRISKKTFYVYFRQKEDLVSEVITFHNDKMLQYLRDKLKGKTALQILIEFMKHPQKYKPSVGQQEKHKAVVYDLQKYYPAVWELQQQRMKEIEKTGIGNLLRLGISEGVFREDLDVELYLVFFQSMTDVFFSLMSQNKVVLDGKQITKQQIYDFYIDLFARQIISEQGLEQLKALS